MKSDRLHGKKTLRINGFLDEFEKDEVKRKVNLLGEFQSFGIALSKKGKGYIGKCPWHQDETSSLSVDQEQGLYHCFGCGESGDVFTLVEKMKGYDFKEALQYLKTKSVAYSSTGDKPSPVGFFPGAGPLVEPSAPFASSIVTPNRQVVLPSLSPSFASEEKAPVPASGGTGVGSEHDTPSQQAEAARDTVEDGLLGVVAAYYHKRLFENPAALEYLARRGLADVRNYERFQIGFADGSVLEKISSKQMKYLQACGILRDNGSEHFARCLVFPVVDDLGTVVSMYGRSIDDEARLKHLYLPGPHRGVFHRKASKVYDEILLTESIIDALSLVELSIENVQALYGTGGFTEEHLRILKDDRVKTVVLALDSDEPGQSASEKHKEKLLTEGFRVKVVSPAACTPEGTPCKDWNELLHTSVDAAKIKSALENAAVFENTAEQSGEFFQAIKDELHWVFTIGEITYRMAGVKDVFIGSLRVSIKAERGDERYFDNLDLYAARGRRSYAGELASVFNLEPRRIEKDLVRMLEYLEDERDRKLRVNGAEVVPVMSEADRELGMSFLKSPRLFEEIVEDLSTLGYVGEDLNKQLLYVAASSRILDDPISVLILSQSASGKSMLVDTVKKLMPPEDVIAVTSLSDQALNYIPSLSHKFLVLGEAVHNDIIEHQIREMLSGKELSRLVTVKEENTGKMMSREVKTPAIVSAVMSGTNHRINPENASRCFVVNADESEEQTKRIHAAQREKHSLERIFTKSTVVPLIIRKHHAAQRLLKKMVIVNPFERHLSFPTTLMRTRRDNDRFIDLIVANCHERQYQKEVQRVDGMEYIECDLEDYRIAYNVMVNGVLSSTMLEIPRGALDLYESMRELSRTIAKKRQLAFHEATFTQRDVREHTGQSQTWIRTHLRVLVEYEYVVVSRGGTERMRGFYRLRADEAIKQLDTSMIPTVEQMAKLIAASNGHEQAS